ncbi:MAG: phosphatidate cytidylyltransferase [Firmicutes bacterium]|nr:phosphatidate cytidylyltransferase [Bacillota bacterium]
MRKRVVTSLVLLPALIFAYLGGVWLQVSLAAVSLVGMMEIYRAMSGRSEPIHYIGCAFAAVYYLILPFIGGTPYFFIFITVFVITVSVYMILSRSGVNMANCAAALYGFFYVAFLTSFIYLVRMYPAPDGSQGPGVFFVWQIFISSFGCDTCSYLIGVNFGRHKLIPALSPQKTVEGAVGGVVGATLLAFVYGLIVSRYARIGDINIVLDFTVIGVVGAVFSIFGDLAASAVKRFGKIKDFGEIFPGHGGVMDRFDGVVFTAPVVYMLMTAMLWRG